jgi:hypothetical protein
MDKMDAGWHPVDVTPFQSFFLKEFYSDSRSTLVSIEAMTASMLNSKLVFRSSFISSLI